MPGQEVSDTLKAARKGQKCLTLFALALVALTVVGCASTSMSLEGPAPAPSQPARVYTAQRREVLDAVRAAAMLTPTWEIVGMDESQGVVLVEQRFRDLSFGGGTRMAITVTPLDTGQMQVEIRTTDAGGPRGPRDHNIARFFGELDQLLEHQ